MKEQYRYPGTRPFEPKDSNLFFGRDKDIKNLSELIVLEKLVVLFSSSGYGKSSLLNAGVIPKLRDEEGHFIISIGLKTQDKKTPFELLLDDLKSDESISGFLADKLNIARELPGDDTAMLWYYIKNIQLLKDNKENPLHKYKSITLVFDQFEELFQLEESQVEAFGRMLATLLHSISPKSVRDLLSNKSKSGSNPFAKDELDELYKPLNLKVVFSLRNDYLFELDKLKKFLPEVYTYTYELLPLNEIQALDALIDPAAKEGNFPSPEFYYAKEATDLIFTSLKDKNNRIETFMLQLIGQHAEQMVIRRKQKKDNITKRQIKIEAFLQRLIGQKAKNKLLGWKHKKPHANKFIVKKGDLGNLKVIYENHYNEIISGLSPWWNPFKKIGARKLIEKKLIKRRKREVVAEDKLTTKHASSKFFSGRISKKSLKKLEQELLVRASKNPDRDGHTYYELSHDTMVEPILMSREKRRKKEVIAWLFTIGILALILGFWLGYNKPPGGEENGNPSSDPTTTTVESFPPEPKIEIIKFVPINMNFTVETLCENASVSISTGNGEGYVYEIEQPDGTKLESQAQDTIFDLLQIGNYTIKVTETSSGTTLTKIFNVPRCNEPNTSKPVEPVKPNPLPKPYLKMAGPDLSDSVKINTTPPKIGVPNVVTYDTWVTRLRAIKDKVPEPCEKSKVRSWHFNEDEVHLIAIRKDTAEDPTQDEVLLLLLIAGKVIPFKSYIPHLEGDCMLARQKRYDLRVSLQRSDLYKDSLSLVSKRFKNPAGDAVVSMQENVHNDPYDIFAAKIREAKPKTDEVYYTFLDEEYLDDHARFDINIVFDDSKTEYLYLPFEM
jgi:hypothetical protein